MSKVYIGNLNFETTEEELRELLSQAGTVVDLMIPMDRFSGRPRGFAFAEFADQDQMNEAIRQFNDYEHRGRTLVVNEARERERRPSFRSPPPDSDFGGGGGGGGGFGKRPAARTKGSRRGLRDRKRGGGSF